MKKLFLSILMLALPLLTSAFDCRVDGIYYNLNNSSKTAEVTFQKYDGSYISDYSGSVTIPEKVTYEGVDYSVTSIGYGAFYNCSNLTSVVIPNTVTSIGPFSFNRCIGLTNVVFGSYITSIGMYAFINCSALTSLTIPNSVTSIGDEAFNGCSGLISLTIGNSVSDIGNSAFAYCSGLTSVVIPNSVTNIGMNAFYNCSGLNSVYISNSVTNIGNWAFFGCKSLTSVTIPNSVVSIGAHSFRYCTALTSVTFPNSLTSIGDYAFSFCESLTSVTIPNSVTSIGENAFSYTGMKTLTLPDELTVIKKSTFQGCWSLIEVVIPEKVEYIYTEAFADCNSLKSVTSLAIQPPFAYDTSFSNYNIPLYVPDESMNSYQTTNPWSKFSKLKTLSGDPIDNICATPTISYADKKLTFSCETEGVEYVYEITDVDIKKGYDAEVDLSATYNISVYATKSGYTNSDVATATLVWTDAIFTVTTPETPTSAKEVKESIPVLISANGGVITVKSEQEGQTVAVYTADGKALGSSTVKDGQATVATNIQRGEIVIVKVGGRSLKVKM